MDRPAEVKSVRSAATMRYLGTALCLVGLAGLAWVWHSDARDEWYPAELLLRAGAGSRSALSCQR